VRGGKRGEVQNQELELKALYQHGDSEQVCEMRLFHHVDCGGERNDRSGEDGLPERWLCAESVLTVGDWNPQSWLAEATQPCPGAS
jgi:hypothetical protein